jgi:hypothetical protein
VAGALGKVYLQAGKGLASRSYWRRSVPSLLGAGRQSSVSTTQVARASIRRARPFAKRDVRYGRFCGSAGDAARGGVHTAGIGAPGLDAVSCSRSTSCLAVSVNSVSLFSTWADVWNGQRWRGIRQTRFDVLADVSCPSSSDCVAAGNFLNKSDSYQPLAQSWGGKTWHLMRPRHVLGGFGGASCVSRSFCMAAGPSSRRIWDGSRWKLAAAGAGTEVGSPVSCATRHFCAALGFEPGTEGLVVWNGEKWRFMNFAAPPFPACPRPAAWPRSSFTTSGFHNVAARFNHGTWRVIKMPGFDERLGPASVSCSRATSCVAVGGSGGDEQHNKMVAAQVWNGTSWRWTNPAGPARLAFLASVSCASPAFCIAVG